MQQLLECLIRAGIPVREGESEAEIDRKLKNCDSLRRALLLIEIEKEFGCKLALPVYFRCPPDSLDALRRMLEVQLRRDRS